MYQILFSITYHLIVLNNILLLLNFNSMIWLWFAQKRNSALATTTAA